MADRQLKGIVLSSNSASENSAMISILSIEEGVISALAPSVKSAKSKIKGACQLMNLSSFYISSNKNNRYNTVKEAKAIKMFLQISHEIKRFALANYFLEIFSLLSPVQTNAYEYVILLYKSLLSLDEKGEDMKVIKSALELKLLGLSGFLPKIKVSRKIALEKAFEAENLMIETIGSSIKTLEFYKKVL